MSEKKGFTLVEVLITIGIATILVTVSMRTYLNATAQRQLDTEADFLVNTLQKAKQRAIARDISPSPGCTNFTAYGLQIRSNGSVVSNILCDATTTIWNTYSLDKVLFDSLSSDPMNIRFTYPYGSLDTVSQQIIIRHDRIDKCITIIIPQLGPINKSNISSC